MCSRFAFISFIALSTLFSGTISYDPYDAQEKIALVTGGARGIGLETTRALLSNNIKGVTLVDIDANTGKSTTRMLNEEFEGNRVIFVHADISQEKELERAFKITKMHWKGLDIVINNAGIMDEVKWKRVVQVNAVGTLQGTFLGFEYMSEGKGGHGGDIINIASVEGLFPSGFYPTYGATKAFITSFGRSLGNEVYYEYNKIRLNTLSPGATNTSGYAKGGTAFSVKFLPNIKQLVTNGRQGIIPQPAENVANAIMFILSNRKNGRHWVVENNEAPYEIIFPNITMMKVN